MERQTKMTDYLELNKILKKATEEFQEAVEEYHKVRITWKEYGIHVNNLIASIKGHALQFDGVYGLPRGGLPIATCVSHALNLPILMYPTKETLVVDDISDTGKALAGIKHKLIATLYTTDWTITKPDVAVCKKLKQSDWIVFPWELE